MHAVAKLLVLVALLSGWALAPAPAGAEGSRSLRVYLFAQQGCPYCRSAASDLSALAAEDRRISLVTLYIDGASPHPARWFERSLAHFGHDQAAVPLVVIGDMSFLGHLSGGRSRAAYERAIRQCLRDGCPDVVAGFAFGALDRDDTQTVAAGHGSRPAGGGPDPGAGTGQREGTAPALPPTVRLPLVGDLDTASLSLAALTVVMAAVDGFNPCAMWVLVFLIGLLLGLDDRRRMWILGGAFLFATAAMYFAVMAAWLNLILFLGAVAWLRAAIGVLAIGAGVLFLREYWTQPDAACRVTSPEQRSRVMASMRAAVNGKNLVVSVVGIMTLAVAVNLIELLCSAGIPAVYTQVLALNDLPAVLHHAYLLLYVVVFLLDDAAIFVTAMVALRVSGLTGQYARFSHLIGGVVLLGLGAVLVLRPDLLAFA
ncbi:hypothetical protein [Polymorphum gilvum]|uniref:Cytochrome c biogenesis protein transmembrane region n=1 Tax=Polymorphum gilvum (strain LMG 25793 / CGMCC 1.9160 / SL003B-26A1) TaxID=991905 RepID=F2IXU2_POLGS|nr:hypothetical protein [Polymorphum gilvum]ADZ69423.1 Cytochrome c biogenesis protein transmembrane region [Polymorphum gilvum SL003B-26A1]